MSVEEIKKAIHGLSPEERRELLESLMPRVATPTDAQKERIRETILSTPEDRWIDWEDLKSEMGH